MWEIDISPKGHSNASVYVAQAKGGMVFNVQ